MNRSRPLIDAVLRRTPAQPVFHWRAARSLAVLAYHDVRDLERFAAQLDYIRQHASAVSISDVIRAAEGRAGLPRRAVLVTFDDGHRDVLDVAMPLLRDRGIPAAAFVVAGLIGTSAPHWWTEVKDLVKAGGSMRAIPGELFADDVVRALKRVPNAVRLASIDELRRSADRAARPVPQLTREELLRLESDGIAIGNHSLTHPCLSTCDVTTVRAEIEGSHEILTEMLGHEIEAFAYPDGDSDARVAGIVREAGHRAAFLFDHRLSATRPPDPFNVSRLRVDTDASADRFRLIVSGLHPTIHRVRGLR
jgi:peptidoglycan/xylan/chitin deacetylase (PgdA/CDA1 family)